MVSLYPISPVSLCLRKVNSAIRNYPSRLPLNAEGGQVQDRADDSDGLHVVKELARRHPKSPRVGEQFGHLEESVCGELDIQRMISRIIHRIKLEWVMG